MDSRIFFFITVFLISIQANAQFADDFSSGNLYDWRGDTSDFIINTDEKLQLMAATSGSSFIYTICQVPDSTVWELDVRLEFAPSGSNQFTWLLQSSSPQYSEWEGYALRLGESGDQDALELIRFDQGTPNLLARMTEGNAADDPVDLKVRIERSEGTFTILASYSGNSVYTDTMMVTDDTYGPGPSLVTGIQCNYTSTRTDKFYFDNYLIGRIAPDNSPPILLDYQVSEREVVLSFNERISLSDAQYNIEGGSFQLRDSLDASGAQLILKVTPGFASLTPYTLTLDSISDEAGNYLDELEIDILFIRSRAPEAFELVINEVMAAPNNVTSLPAIEYVEVYNRSDDHLELGGIFLQDETSLTALPSYQLAPQEYLILCDAEDTSSLAPYGKVLGLEGMVSLNNGGDFIQLRRNNGGFIHGWDYTDNWYKDPDRDDGGYSLELIHPDLACSREEAVGATQSPLGGTPGKVNSIYSASFEDSLQITQTGLLDASSLLLGFDQWLNTESGLFQQYIEITPNIGIDNVFIRQESPNVLEILTSEPLAEGTLYSLTLSENFPDCKNSAIDRNISTQLGVPAIPDSGDLLISEIMFDPLSGQSQWVEVYNNTSEVFEFTYLVLKFIDADGSSQAVIGLEDQILPDEYFVLCENIQEVADQYRAPFHDQLLNIDLPSIDRDGGMIELWYIFGAEAKRLDRVCYQADWHSAFLREEKGVSLERLRFDVAACTSNNWQSAAEASYFGTPTGKNSQSFSPDSVFNKQFSLVSPTFSPDGDGFEDFALILFQNENPESSPPQLNLNIYTPNGLLIEVLLSNYSLSAEDQILWDGRMSNGQLAPEGFYILQAETFDKNGQRSRWQATIYLTYPQQ